MSDVFRTDPVTRVVRLDGVTGAAQLKTHVSNRLDRDVHAAVKVQAEQAAESGWVIVEPASFALDVNQSTQLNIRFATPGVAQPGEHRFRVRVHDVDQPADAFAVSPQVTAVVPSETSADGTKSLMLLLVVSILLVLALAVWLLFGRSGTVTVPDVTGLTVQEALAELEDAGLGFGEAIATPGVQPSGTILFQDPDGGDQASVGTGVDARVAFDDPGVAFEVPQVAERSEDRACELIREAGLVCEVSFAESSAQEGQVIGQSPGAGVQLDIGDSVTITVSTGS